MAWFIDLFLNLVESRKYISMGKNVWEDISMGEDDWEDYSRIRAKERTIKEAKEKRNKIIYDKISEYKEKQILQIEKKYRVVIDFVSERDLKEPGDTNISKNNTSTRSYTLGEILWENLTDSSFEDKKKVIILKQDQTLQNEIDNLKKEKTELEEAIKELETIKNETLK